MAVLSHCSTPVPVRELSDARQGVDLAEKEGAGESAPDAFKASREALLEAHKNLADEKYGNAKKNADLSLEKSREARLVSAPAYTARQKSGAEASLQAADRAFASELAADDLQKAKDLLAKGEDLQKKADASAADVSKDPSKATAEQKDQTLGLYQSSYATYQDAKGAADGAKTRALSRTQDFQNSVSAAEATLRKADAYDGRSTASSNYSRAESELNTARTDINSGNLRTADGHIKEGQRLATLALEEALRNYAVRKRGEAGQAIAGAETDYKNAKPAPPVDQGTAAYQKKIDEYLAAGREALGSSDRNMQNRQFEDSLKDSNEALNLARIIKEQIAGMSAAVATARGGKVNVADTTAGKSVPAEKTPAKTETTAATATSTTGGKSAVSVETSSEQGEWKEYTVQKKVPADNLWRIAGMKKHYSNPKLWPRIFKANKKQIRNPNLIYPGQKLTIPPKEGSLTPPANTGKTEGQKATTGTGSASGAKPASQTEGQPVEAAP